MRIGLGVSLGISLSIALVLGLVFGARAGFAQVGVLGGGIEDERPTLPNFTPEISEAPRKVLPQWQIPTPEPFTPQADPLAAETDTRFKISAFEFVGNTVIDTATLDMAAHAELGPTSTRLDLRRIRDTITQLYIDRGYVTSGARIPPQTLVDGRLRIEIVEGRLTHIELRESGHFRESYLRDRLTGQPNEVVDAEHLRERLRHLQEDDRIQRIDAALVPDAESGQSRLIVSVAPTSAIRAAADFSNYQSDDIREEHGRFEIEHGNFTGWGDRFRLTGRFGLGVRDIGLRYTLPIHRQDTTLGLAGRYSESRIQDDAFRDDRITSQFWSVGFELRHPLLRSEETTLSLFALAEFRTSQTKLLGRPFPFVVGADDGRSRISALRLGADYARRTRRDAVALRATLSAGLPIFGATRNSGATPDGQFFHLFIQSQWARRLTWRDATFVARGDLQLATNPLLPLEQFAVGGHASVRGYEENRLIRDNALVGGVELRVPVWQRAGRNAMSLGPIADIGYAFNTDRPEKGATTLASIGLQTRINLLPGVFFELSWSRTLLNRDTLGDPSLQKRGLHLRVRSEY